MTNKKQPQVRNGLEPQMRVSIKFEEPSITVQGDKDSCDINRIMSRFQKTGAIEHFAAESPRYGYATSIDFREAQNLLIEADRLFSGLPSGLRTKFDNDPAVFLDFVQNPANLDEMRELGLAHKLHPVENAHVVSAKTELNQPPTSATE